MTEQMKKVASVLFKTRQQHLSAPWPFTNLMFIRQHCHVLFQPLDAE